MDHVYPSTLVAEIRQYLSCLPVALLRERMVKLLYVITDLASQSPQLVVGTPLNDIIPRLVLDLLYGGTFKREGNFSIFDF